MTSGRDNLRSDAMMWLDALRRHKPKRNSAPRYRPGVDEEPHEDLLRIAWVTDVVFGGNHHIPSPDNLHNGEKAWAVFRPYPSTLASFDFSELTRLVAAAHESAVRVCLGVRGFRQLELTLSARSREGGMASRHPTLEDGLKRLQEWRWWPCPIPIPQKRPHPSDQE